MPSTLQGVEPEAPPTSSLENALQQSVRSAVLEAVAPLADFAGPSLNTEQAARYLSVSPRTLETLVSNGEIKPARLTPRTRRFLRETLDTFLRSRLS